MLMAYWSVQTCTVISAKAQVLVVGSRIECPPGCERIHGAEAVKQGAFFEMAVKRARRLNERMAS